MIDGSTDDDDDYDDPEWDERDEDDEGRIRCPDCDGTGLIGFERNSVMDASSCPECDGSGWI